MTGEDIYRAVETITGQPRAQWLGFRETITTAAPGGDPGLAVVIISTGQKYKYSARQVQDVHDARQVQIPLPTPADEPDDAPADATPPAAATAPPATTIAGDAAHSDIIQPTQKPVEAPPKGRPTHEPKSASAPGLPPAALQANGRRSPSGDKKRPRARSK